MVASAPAIPARVCAATCGHFITAYPAASSGQVTVTGAAAAQQVGSPGGPVEFRLREAGCEVGESIGA